MLLEFGYLFILKNQLHVGLFCAASIITPVCIMYRTHRESYAMWHPHV
jgi:hypothetical protein